MPKIEKDSKNPNFQDLYKVFSKKYPSHVDVEFMPSGSVILDRLMGGGIPRGKFVEFFSEPGLGKTLIVKSVCEGFLESSTEDAVLYIDAERAVASGILTGVLTESLGSRFMIMPVSTFEEIEDAILQFTADPHVKLVVIDSMTSVIPGIIMGTPIKDIRPGLKAQYQAAFCDKFKALADIRKFTILFVSQKRVKLNFKGISTTDSAGGYALKYYMDIRFSMRILKKLIDDRGDIIGAHVEVKSVKNKLAGNIKSELLLRYGKGISNIGAYIYFLGNAGLVTQSGSVYIMKIPELGFDEHFKGAVAMNEFVEKNVKVIAEFLVKSGLITRPMSEEEIVESEREAEE